jgi:hypothetical protein
MHPGLGPPQQLTPYAQYLATRSAIPRVVGILATIFAAIGLLGSIIWVWGPGTDLSIRHRDGRWDAEHYWLLTWGALSAAVFVVHLVAGLMSISYRPSAPRLARIYGVAAIALALLDVVLVLALEPSGGHHHAELHESVVTLHIVFSGIALPWPITMLILMETSAAKRACVIPPR